MLQNILRIFVVLLVWNLLSCKHSQSDERIVITSDPSAAMAQDGAYFPKAIGLVNDYQHLFEKNEQTELTEILLTYETLTTRQIVVATVDSITPYTDVQKYATDLGNRWGVGTSQENNGLILVLCISCKKVAIATGLGTQQALTDKDCKRIIDNTMIPQFTNGNYYLGVKEGIQDLIKNWD